jgi:hypothetical protein
MDIHLHPVFVPMWFIALLFLLVLLGSLYVGTLLRRYVPIDPATVGSGQLLTGSLATLSLLIGFTFSLALNRHDERRDLLLEESNAIRELHRALVHVEEPGRSEIGDALAAYAKGRLAFVSTDLFRQEELEDARAAERERLNRVVTDVVPQSDTGISQSQILASATRILDAGSRMEQVMLAHVPPRVVLVLFLLATGSAVMIGVSIGPVLAKLWLPALLWSFFMSIVLFTIVDLDAPHWGSIQLNSRPLQTAVRVTNAPDGKGTTENGARG